MNNSLNMFASTGSGSSLDKLLQELDAEYYALLFDDEGYIANPKEHQRKLALCLAKIQYVEAEDHLKNAQIRYNKALAALTQRMRENIGD